MKKYCLFALLVVNGLSLHAPLPTGNRFSFYRIKHVPLLDAIKTENLDEAKRLLEEGANPAEINNDGESALLIYLGKNVDLALKKLNNNDQREASANTQLRTALLFDRSEDVQNILECGANPFSIDEKECKNNEALALIKEAKKNRKDRIATILLCFKEKKETNESLPIEMQLKILTEIDPYLKKILTHIE